MSGDLPEFDDEFEQRLNNMVEHMLEMNLKGIHCLCKYCNTSRKHNLTGFMSWDDTVD